MKYGTKAMDVLRVDTEDAGRRSILIGALSSDNHRPKTSKRGGATGPRLSVREHPHGKEDHPVGATSLRLYDDDQAQ